MKTYRFWVPCLVLFVVLLSWVCIPSTEAASLWPKTSKVLCWEAKEEGTVVGIMKVGVKLAVGMYYLLNGEIIVDGATHSIIFGTARVGTDKVLITATDSGKSSTSMWTDINHVILDKNTLNGTYDAIGHDYANYDTPFDSGGGIYIDSDTQYSSGVLTYIKCP